MTSPTDGRVMRVAAVLEEIALIGADLLNAGKCEDGEVALEKLARSAAILDGAIAVTTLLKSNGQSHASTIVRSLVELVGDLYWLVQDPTYLLRLKFTASKQMCDAARHAIKRHKDDPAFARVIAQQEEILHVESAKLREMTKENPSLAVLKPYVRIAPSGVPPAVHGIYAKLCQDAHHDHFSISTTRINRANPNVVEIGDTLTINEAMGIACLAGICVVSAIEAFSSFITTPPDVTEAKVGYARALRGTLDAMWPLFRVSGLQTAPATE